MAKEKLWIIGIGGSDEDGVGFIKFNGTDKEVKRCLMELVNDRNEFEIAEHDDEMEFGTEDISEISKVGSGYYAYASFYDYHVDYMAVPFEDIQDYSKYEKLMNQ